MRTRVALSIVASMAGLLAFGQERVADLSSTNGLFAGGSWRGTVAAGTDAGVTFARISAGASDVGQLEGLLGRVLDFSQLAWVSVRYRLEAGNNVSGLDFVLTDGTFSSAVTRLPLSTGGSAWQTVTVPLDLTGLDRSIGVLSWALVGRSAVGTAGTALRISLSDITLLTIPVARPLVFDAEAYLAANPDVAAAIGNVPSRLERAWVHYWTYGLAEGRLTGDGFVVDDYLAINPDLQAVFGTDRQGALLHWLAYGKQEGRMGSVPPQFELDTYFALNPDVLAVFGSNRRLAWFHFATYGILEGRSLDGWFSPAAYLAMYPDLVPALGGKPLAALGHWFRYGRAEGRGIPVWFDIVGYLARYPDVEAAYGTDLYGAWRHFVRWGAAAGRSPDPKFDPVAYLAAYPELRAGLGDDPVKALQHWIDWGKQEGRLGSIPAGWDPAYYLAHNPDLVAFGDDEAILWQHCIAYGVLEGREVAVDVKPSVYLALNPDLNVAFGGSQQKAMLHWYLYGKAEGRLGR